MSGLRGNRAGTLLITFTTAWQVVTLSDTSRLLRQAWPLNMLNSAVSASAWALCERRWRVQEHVQESWSGEPWQVSLVTTVHCLAFAIGLHPTAHRSDTCCDVLDMHILRMVHLLSRIVASKRTQAWWSRGRKRSRLPGV